MRSKRFLSAENVWALFCAEETKQQNTHSEEDSRKQGNFSQEVSNRHSLKLSHGKESKYGYKTTKIIYNGGRNKVTYVHLNCHYWEENKIERIIKRANTKTVDQIKIWTSIEHCTFDQ